MKKNLLLLTFFLSIAVFSQQKKFNITWDGYKLLSANDFNIEVPFFNPENFNYSLDKGLQFISQWSISNFVNEASVSIENVSYVTISKGDLKGVNLKTIPSELLFQLKNSISRDKHYAFLSISPIIKNKDGSYKKITSFSVNFNSRNRNTSQNNQRREIINSVLSSGSWYRFYVNKSGVFRISKNFLEQLGVNVNSIDPRTLKVFGNGGKMIPYSNAINYPIDLAENAIRVIGEGDGVFNNEDYILFYAEGPKGIVDDNRINTNVNPYSDKSYYYINVSSGSGKRIEPFIQPTGNIDLVIDTFQDYQYHELDEYNLVSVGRRWFGDRFDVENVKTFEFSFPDIITTEPVNFKVYVAATSDNLTTMEVGINGTTITTLNLPGAEEPNLATESFYISNINVNSSDITVNLSYDNSGIPSSLAYLDYISIEATRELNFYGTQFLFKNNAVSQAIGIGQYNMANTSQVSEIWEVTDLYNITNYLNIDSSSTLSFNSELGILRSYVAVTPTDYFSPLMESNPTVLNQNIKGTIFQNDQGQFQDIDYIIIAPNNLFSQAERLAQINRNKYNLNVKVVTLNEIYMEFSSGSQDIGAIRNLVKYVYDNASSPDNRIKYLCLFGDGSYDYKDRVSNNTNIVPAWHAYESFNLTNSFVSDDFYGMMDENEGAMEVTDKLDIAVGRMLIDSPQRAIDLVDKVESYYIEAAFGRWRNNFVVVSDDVDQVWERVLQETTDQIGNTVSEEKPFINVVKLHSDAFQQESSAGGERYPQVKEAMINAIENGALVVNYFGHGGEDGLAAERIFEKPDAQNLGNVCKLNCFVTITCEYTRFDNPHRPTAGEFTYWNKNGGAIGLITTTRQIFVSVGITFNNILEEYLFSFNDSDNFEDYEYPSMAEALRLTKTNPSISGIAQRRLVFFIGDPAMKLAFPEPSIRLTKINGVSVNQQTDVLEALSHVTLTGEITDVSGAILNDYNGILSTTIYDKKIDRQTLGNNGVTDGGQLIVLNFETLGEVIFRGQASITNGQFEFDFIVPRDIGIPVGLGKVSFYAKKEGALQDQAGADLNSVRIGGLNENAPEDNIGPVISLYMNDENFVSGGITNESPTLLAKLEDENGINTASGIGHDIVAIIDGEETNPYVLNDYYQTEVDDYQKGLVSFPFRDLSPGLHTLTLKAWDVYNNSSIAEIQFVVHDKDESLVINNVLNYPNPFVNYTEFWFNHNSLEPLDVSVQIFTVSGKLVRTINGQTKGGVKITSSLSKDIVWDGRDDFGDKIGKGVYIYKLTVKSNTLNKKVEKIEKLVIL